MEQKRNYHEPCACQKPAPVPCDKPKCDNCRGSKGNCFCLPPKVIPVEVDGCPILFRKVIIPVSVGDETTYPPVNGLYRNVLLEYESSGSTYLYSSDGIPTHVVNDLEQIEKLIRELVEAEAQTRSEADDRLQDNIDSAVTTLSKAIGEETSAREGADRILDGKIEAETRARGLADNEIWAEINTIEIASDVVDIVGTYAALQAYDTSHLQDNDIIKVLSDETRSNATTYYRWNKTTSQFSYVGEEGPYYTTSQTDQLLAGKQDTLTAGKNIGITNNVISSDSVVTIYEKYVSDTHGTGFDFYRDAELTDKLTKEELIELLKNSHVSVASSSSDTDYSNVVYRYKLTTSGTYEGWLSFYAYEDTHFYVYQWHPTQYRADKTDQTLRYTAGNNITIAGNNVISATDTTYSDFTGTDGTAAGTAGLVPAPATTDAGKFLKADGTWGTAGGAANNINSTDWNALWQ